jgi:hypothetical protein
MSTPTQRSLRHLREAGYLADVVERWIPGAKVRRDLFGIVDIIGIHTVREGDIVGVQTTSAGNVAARVAKIIKHENVSAVRRGGIKLLVHGWAKRNGRWQLREVDVS